MFKSVCTLLGCALCLSSALCLSQGDVWRFTQEAQMRAAIEQYKDNPRATYYIIVRASHQHLAPQAAMIYLSLLDIDQYNPKREAAYAFSQFMAAGALSEYALNYGAPSLVQKLRQQQLKAEYNRALALSATPKSPETLLEAAIPLGYTGDYQSGSVDRRKACDYLRKAVRLAPEWADAHYWLAVMLNSLWSCNMHGPTYVAEELSELQKAESLEPKLHTDCQIQYAYTYQELNLPEKQLEHLNAYIKAKPVGSINSHIIDWRDNLARQSKDNGRQAPKAMSVPAKSATKP